MWGVNRATFYGTKTNPKDGQYVEIVLYDPDAPTGPRTHTMTFAYSEGTHGTMAAFQTAVKLEVGAELARRNAEVTPFDMTSNFTP